MEIKYEFIYCDTFISLTQHNPMIPISISNFWTSLMVWVKCPTPSSKTPNLYTTLPNQVAMPPQVSNLRLLFFSPFPPLSLSPLKPSFSLFPKSKPYSLLTALASSSNHKRRRPIPYQSPNLGPRSKSTLRESRHRDKGMEDKTESVAFNKRRAEGNDKNERPKKNLQRRVRALNPTNTIAYVQVCKGFSFLGFL